MKKKKNKKNFQESLNEISNFNSQLNENMKKIQKITNPLQDVQNDFKETLNAISNSNKSLNKNMKKIQNINDYLLNKLYEQEETQKKLQEQWITNINENSEHPYEKINEINETLKIVNNL